jgi:hypothetical protein
MKRLLLVLAVTAALGACRDRDTAAPADTSSPVPPEMHGAVYLGVSDMSPKVGDTIVVTANVGVDDSLSVASFVTRLDFDARGIAYVGEVQLPGMLRVVNPRTGEVTVAGASAQASAQNGVLFALRFRIDDPQAMRSFALTVDELNDSNYTSQLSALRPRTGLLLGRQSPSPKR